jgi:hypothetical protein
MAEHHRDNWTRETYPVAFLNPNDGSWSQTPRSTNDEDLDKDENSDEDLAHTTVPPPPPTSTGPLVPMPSTPELGLNPETGPVYRDNSQRSTCPEVKAENRLFLRSKSFDNFKALHWSNNGCGWHPCAVCGDTKLTCWQAETFKDEKLWLCEDCKTTWKKERMVTG